MRFKNRIFWRCTNKIKQATIPLCKRGLRRMSHLCLSIQLFGDWESCAICRSKCHQTMKTNSIIALRLILIKRSKCLIISYWNKYLPMAKFDLHFHSTYSDGKLSVPELASIIKFEKLKFCALVDHNCIDGIRELEACLDGCGVTVIAG